MPTLIKNSLISLAAIVAGGVMVAIVQMISHQLYPPPTGIDFNDPDQLAAFMDQVPLGAKLWVVASWAIGMMTGAGIGLFLSGRTMWVATAAIVGLMGATSMNFFMIPHPVWMIAGAFLVAILVWLGAKRVANP